MFCRVLTVALAGLCALPAQALDWGVPDPGEQLAIETIFADTLTEAAAAGADTFLLAARPDLDEDGVPDLMGWIQNGYICSGAGGCPITIFLNRSGNLQYAGFINADIVELAESSTNGMRDLEIISMAGMVIYRWDGTGYFP